ncbi:MAG: response regulator, partial [Pirellulaceae bacterium]|nr:response regulator [Pirellulaceae bacterium]
PNEAPAAGELRVLIVEDSEIDAQLLVRELQRFGYAPEWERVDDPKALQAALVRQSWDLVLADYSMPRFSGLDALDLVNASKLGVPFILVSGTIGEETAVSAMRAGASDGAAVRRSLLEAEQRRARRQAEDRLRLLFHAVEQSPAMITITDPAGSIEYVNPRFTTLTGYTLDMLLGRNSRILKSGHTSPAEYERLWKTIAAGGEWWGEFSNRRKNGELFWESAAISPVRDDLGQITHFIKVAEDITERKRMDEALRKLESQLRRAQKTEALGELAGGIAHDFNNFLGAVIMNAQLARSTGAPDTQNAEYLDQVIAASRQAAGLARQMLTFSRRGEQRRCPIQLGPPVLETLRLLRASLPAGSEVEIDVRPGGRMVLADAAQVQQVVVNLWTNACHALAESGGRIVVSLADVDVDTEMAAQHSGLTAGPYVRLTVRDSGCGMPPEIQEQIFEPFFSTKPEGQGTGLGLPVVQSIMTGHQGAIVVDSRPQAGTAMHLFFPAERPAAAAAPALEKPPPGGSGERILLVDDHALVRDAMRSLLEQLGYRAIDFGRPLEALAAFRAHPHDFDLVLTDLSMSEMNGAELARELLIARPDIPVIISSGYELAGVAQHLRDLGIREVLTKPIQREGLAAALMRALGQGDRQKPIGPS